MTIYSYTAADAMRDGILHDIGPIAWEAGFSFPVRITTVLKDLLTPKEGSKEHGQSYEGRLWDVLMVAKFALLEKPNERLVSFEVHFYNSPTDQLVKTLWAALDQTSGPAIHIMLPEEY